MPSNPVTKIMNCLGNGSIGKETEKITGLPGSSRVKGARRALNVSFCAQQLERTENATADLL